MVYYFEGKILVAYLIICLFFIAVATYKKKKCKIAFALLCGGFCLYLYHVIALTQFPIYSEDPFAETLSEYIWNRINLVPFKDCFNRTSVQNIVMMMPLGFLLPLIRGGKISVRSILIVAVLSGIVLECMQLTQMLVQGYTFRVIDVNDVIFNFSGVMLGFLCYSLLRKAVLRMNRRFDCWFAEQL